MYDVQMNISENLNDLKTGKIFLKPVKDPVPNLILINKKKYICQLLN